MNGERVEPPVFTCSTSAGHLASSSAAASAVSGQSKRLFHFSQGSSVGHANNVLFTTMAGQNSSLQDGLKNESIAKDKQLQFSKMDPSTISVFHSVVDVSPTSFLQTNTLPSLPNSLLQNSPVNRNLDLNSHISQLTSRMSSQEILNVTSASSLDTSQLLIRNSSCDSSLSELTPSIAPVNLIDNSFDVHSPLKDVLIAGNDYSKDNLLPPCTSQHKETSCTSSTPTTSNGLLNKLLHSSKPEHNIHIPMRKSEFGKIPNLSLKVVTAPKVSEGMSQINKPNVGASHIVNNPTSSDKIHLSNEYRSSASTSVTNSAMVVIASSLQPFSQTNNNYVLPDGYRQMEASHPVSLPGSTYNDSFNVTHSSANCSPIPHNSNQNLCSSFSTIKQNKAIHIPQKVVREAFESESLHPKMARTPNSISTEYHVENRTEHLLLGGDPLFTSAPTTALDSTQGLNFITDHQVLPQFSQINDMPPESSKDHSSCKQVDILLSQIQPEEDNELALGSLTNSITADLGSAMETNPSPVVSEPSLSATIGDDQANLPELPPSPLLPNMSSDFLVGSSSAAKTPPCQQTFQAYLPNLSTDLTLSFSSPFLENSISIDMSSFSEADVSFNANPQGFPESLDSSSHKKGNGGIELNFTNALKQSLGGEQSKSKLPGDIFHSPKLSNSTSTNFDGAKPPFSLSPEVKEEMQKSSRNESSPQRNPSLKKESNPDFSQKLDVQEASEEKPQDDSLMQQVSCFKCKVCSYLCLEKDDMTEHMKLKHTKTSTSEEQPAPSAKEEKPPDEKRRKYASRKKKATDCKVEMFAPEPGKFEKRIVMLESEDAVPSRRRKQSRKEKRIKTPDTVNPDEPDSIDSFEFSKSKSKFYSPLDEDTNGSSSTNEGQGATKKPSSTNKPGRPPASQSVGITKFRKKHPDVVIPDDLLGFRCGINGCGLRMKEKENILYHRECHVEAFLKCPECQVNYAHWSALAMHLWKEHMLDMELHKCEKCDYKSYSYTKLMNGHFRSHSTERPFLCDVCGKDFKTSKQLRTHKSLHSEKNCAKKEIIRFSCEMCNRRFSEKRMLFSHLEAVHKKVKPYLCNFCGKSFASKSTLNLHIRKHTGEKPFACEKCEYRTSDHNSMRRHKMKHSNDKRYSCPYCDYSSIQSSTYKVHLRRKHEIQAQKDGIIFSCSMCTFKTVKKDNFLAHIGTHHNITEEEQNIAAELQQQQFNKAQLMRDLSKEESIVGLKHEVFLKEELTPILPDDISVTPIAPTPPSAAAVPAPPAQDKGNCTQTYYVMQVPHVVNIDVNNGDAALEVPQSTSLVNSVLFQDLGCNVLCPTSLASQLSGQIVMGSPEEYDRTITQQLDVNDGILQLSREIISANISPTIGNPGENVIYVSTSTEGESNLATIDRRILQKEDWE